MDGEVAPSVQRRAAVHAALGEPARLQIVDALVLSDASPSELGELVGVESNLLAHHLNVLIDAGLVEGNPSHGDRRRRYLRVRPDGLELLARSLPLEASSVLFVCTANSARSQLAAALWNGRSAVPATSVGTEPAARIHPQARRVARRRGLDLSGQRPTSLHEAGASADVVVTVCDRAHEQLRRRLVGACATLHWSVADPAEVGTPASFTRAADELELRIVALASLVVPPSTALEARNARP